MEIIKMYEKVFEDIVRNYIEEENCENEEKIELDDDTIKDIADKMIYKNGSLWEVINGTVEAYITCELKNKEED